MFLIGLPMLFIVSVLFLNANGTAQTPLSSQEKRGRPVGDTITIGTALPANGQLAELGEAMRSVLAAAFAEANLNGGINQRLLELKVTETGDNPAVTRANMERLIKNENVFAFVGAMIAGAETEVVSLVNEQQVPLVGPQTLITQSGVPVNHYVFYILPGIECQTQALVKFVANQSGAKRPTIGVVYSETKLNSKVSEGIQEQSRKESLSAPQVYEYRAGSFDAAGAVNQLRGTNVSSVFFAARSEDLNAFLINCDKVGWYPQVLLPGVFAGRDINDAPIGFQRKLFLSFPTVPEDVNTGLQEFQALVEKYKLPSKHVAAQISTYVAAKILIEALKKAGTYLTRDRLIQTLETFNSYQTGLTPNITYGPSRRIGAMGAYVVMIDLKEKKYVPASDWINLN
jgi:ABC-type branched-subunit amino acid transport system substrate-binding protein